MKNLSFILYVVFFFAFNFPSVSLAETITLNQDQVNELKLTLDLASLELTSLKTQLQISKEELTMASSNVRQLKNELDAAKKSYQEMEDQKNDYYSRMVRANRLHRNSTIAGILLGITTGVGATLAITGAVKKSPPVAWSGVGIGGTALLTWIVGYCLEVW